MKRCEKVPVKDSQLGDVVKMCLWMLVTTAQQESCITPAVVENAVARALRVYIEVARA